MHLAECGLETQVPGHALHSHLPKAATAAAGEGRRLRRTVCQPVNIFVLAIGAVVSFATFVSRDEIARRAYASKIVGEGCMATGFAVATLIVGVGAILMLIGSVSSCVSP